MKKVVIIGSTGSIGEQTIDVLRNQDSVEIYALTAGKNLEKHKKQLIEIKPKYYDNLEKIRRSNMQNADILEAIKLQQTTGISASPELLAEARKRGLGQTMDGTDTAKFQEFGPIKKFFSMRWRKLVNAGISVGGLIKNLGKIAIDYVKAGAKIFMMSL